MSFCSNCGNKINDNEKFCSSCGMRLTDDVIIKSATEASYGPDSNVDTPKVDAPEVDFPKENISENQNLQPSPASSPVSSPVSNPVKEKPAKMRKSRKILLITGIVLTALIVVGAVLAVVIGYYSAFKKSIEITNYSHKLATDDEALAIHCAKKTVAQTYDVDVDDIDWKDIDCIVADRDDQNVVYVECKFKDSDGERVHLKWFILVYDIDFNTKTNDVDWSAAWVDWDEYQISYKDMKKQILAEVDK